MKKRICGFILSGLLISCAMPLTSQPQETGWAHASWYLATGACALATFGMACAWNQASMQESESINRNQALDTVLQKMKRRESVEINKNQQLLLKSLPKDIEKLTILVNKYNNKKRIKKIKKSIESEIFKAAGYDQPFYRLKPQYSGHRPGHFTGSLFDEYDKNCGLQDYELEDRRFDAFSHTAARKTALCAIGTLTAFCGLGACLFARSKTSA